MNNEKCDDSNFQKKGDYIMEKMPKYKYNIKIIHDSPHMKKKKKTHKIVSSARFSILNDPKYSLKKIKIRNNYKNNNNEIFNQLHRSQSPRMGTIRFYPQELCLQNNNDNILNNSYKKLYNSKGIYYQNYDSYRINNNNQNYNNNMDYYNKNQIIHNNYNNDKFRNNKLSYNNNYFFNNNDFNNCENENGSYIINIFPKKPCICHREINKLIDEFYLNDKGIHNCNDLGFNRVCRCGLKLNGRKNMIINNDNIDMRKKNKYKYYNYCSPPRSMRNRYPKAKDRPMKELQYPKCNNNYPKYINISLNYRRPFYYFIKDDKLNDKENSIPYNINNNPNIDNNDYSQNYFDKSIISNKSNLKNEKEILTKKIKISSYKSPKKEIGNNSFISVDNINNKNLMLRNSPYMQRKKLDKIKYNNITKYESKDQNLSNNLNNTCISIGRRSNNIIINKSSEKKEKIKIFPLSKKIYPLVVKKSVEKPKKEKIINKDGTTTNVIKQTSVITSIESSPIQTKKNNLKNQAYVKENITKIYTTLVKDDIDDNINRNHIINRNRINIIKSNENLNNDNLNLSNYNKYKVNDMNIDMNYEDINDDINDIDNNFLMLTKSSNNINNNSPIINSSINSNTYEESDFNNPSKVNKHIKYLKYLYNRFNNSNSIGENNEESLSSYFLKLNDEEKKEILDAFKDGKVEDKTIYNKLMKIIKESILSEVKNNFGDDKMFKSNN